MFNCQKAYRIINSEFQFLKSQKLPLPRSCINCRHENRISHRNRHKLYHRRCMCDYKVYKNTVTHASHLEGQCPNEFETSYAPNRPEIVYCETCYNAEVV